MTRFISSVLTKPRRGWQRQRQALRRRSRSGRRPAKLALPQRGMPTGATVIIIALQELAIAAQTLPNEPAVFELSGYVMRQKANGRNRSTNSSAPWNSIPSIWQFCRRCALAISTYANLPTPRRFSTGHYQSCSKRSLYAGEACGDRSPVARRSKTASLCLSADFARKPKRGRTTRRRSFPSRAL